MAEKRAKRRGFWGWFMISVLLAVIVLAIVGQIMVHRAGPILKGRVIETLSTRFRSRVEMDEFHVSLLRGLEVSGEGLRIFAPDEVVAAGATLPVIGIEHFEFHSGLMGLFVKPMHVGTVHVTGLAVNIPPKEMRAKEAASAPRKGKMKIVVDEIVCDDSRLIIGTEKPGKDPKDFELRHIVMREIGPDAPWQYDATLVNAIPKGNIHATGTFGPWVTESPGDSSVTGKYTFDNADLNTIKGIGGMLSSVGEFTGQLDRIAVNGTTETPNFSLDTANHGMPLHTKFAAVVDGTSGDTYLNQVEARLGGTNFMTKGTVISEKGKGHRIELDVDVPHGRIQDFLQLAIKTEPVIMNGSLQMKAKIHIRPGPERVAEKLGLKGDFTVQEIHFSNPAVQDKVDMLSERAQGNPKAAKPGAEDVRSRLAGTFTMDGGKLNFSKLGYVLPGGNIDMEGVYSLDGAQFDFHGKVRMEAKISQMVASRWKSLLLKPVDPFFRKDGSTEIPVKISGTKSEPKFGLDLGHKDKDETKGKSD
ncbi:AsmA-like C-terminal region-containing protein [Granulicella arctica]|uniref:AsmA-like C-terminal region-containing protein n=1 Tax=Granulicella arctica TaxID=940613 RepID=UPI0021E0D006|nr:AsmA-like C-terminal region-containing protein [Granulicella arctica]